LPRKITAAAFVSLDGVMQGPGGPVEDTTGGFSQGGWVFKLGDEGLNETLGGLFSGEYDLLLGRRTYDIFAAYWPFVSGDETPIADAFNRANKYVLSRGNPSFEWENSHRLAGVEDVAELRLGHGPDLIVQGSSTLYPPLLAHGVIDRMILMTFPLVLGTGKRLFGEGTAPGLLKMVDHRVTDKGTVIATYEPGGPVPDYPADAPPASASSAEKERQKRMEEGSW
jgi:dihydrofolate reductase